MTNALELLKSAATNGAVTGKSPVDIFYGKIETQLDFAKQLKDGKPVNSRSTWFRKDGAGYIVRIGRNAFEIAGSKLFRAKDIDGVVDILNAAKMAIEQDKALQDNIALHSMERSERLKKGRAAGKTKRK